MSSILETLDTEIKTVRQKLTAIEQEIQQARVRNAHDSFALRQATVPLQHRQGVLGRRLSDLEYERRCQTPAGSSDYRSGAVFFGSDR
jgi:septal ring factor EnvC (AmiA/AmiB activator)